VQRPEPVERRPGTIGDSLDQLDRANGSLLVVRGILGGKYAGGAEAVGEVPDSVVGSLRVSQRFDPHDPTLEGYNLEEPHSASHPRGGPAHSAASSSQASVRNRRPATGTPTIRLTRSATMVAVACTT
jgi:hypothetical protein